MDNTIEDNFENTAIIVSDGCCVQLGNLQVLDDVTFSINKGKKVAVVGPNGGGKSTLFNAIAGLIPIVDGSLKIKGMSPEDARGTISYVPQKDLINKNFPLSVKQVVEMGLIDRKSLNLFSRKKINIKIKQALENVGLQDKIDENINNLSGGQFQRVLIARGLAQNADILLLDEAFSAVDVGAQEDIMNLISDINLDGKTILIAKGPNKESMTPEAIAVIIERVINSYLNGSIKISIIIFTVTFYRVILKHIIMRSIHFFNNFFG